MRIRIELLGEERLVRLLTEAGRDAAVAVARGLREEADLIFAESQRLVPVDTGALRSSGNVEGPRVSGNEAEVLIGYGGAASEYALTVHEDLNAQHPVGQAKYLEQPVAQAAPRLAARLADRVEEIMR